MYNASKKRLNKALAILYLTNGVIFMKVAVIGSRTVTVNNIGDYLPPDTTELVSGGAKGVDTCVREYAESNGIPIKEFLPEYNRYGRGAPLKRNIQIIDYADLVIAFWDGKSRGTKMVIDTCQKNGKQVHIHIM